MLALVPTIDAQGRSDQQTEGRWSAGPIDVVPTLSLHDVGWESNVFNEAEQEKGDFTYTLTPRAAVGLRLPALRLALTSQVDVVYFRTYTSERSTDTDHHVAVEVPLGPLTLGASSSYTDASRRSNSEIDSRSRRVNRAVAMQAGLRFSGVTSMRLEAERAQVAYDSDEVFDGANLAENLNRDEDRVSAALRYAITPLTTLVFTGDVETFRFQFSPRRNAESFSFLPGVEFDALAALNGRAAAGFRSFAGRALGLPDFKGLVGSVDLTYPYRPGTSFSASFERDVRYSYRDDAPYYVLTGYGGSIRQRFAQTWETEARAGLESHDYRTALATKGRPGPDVTVNYSARLSHEVTATSRVLIDASLRRRRSPVDSRNYRGARIYAAVALGY